MRTDKNERRCLMEYMYGNAVRKLTMSYMHLKCSEIEKKKNLNEIQENTNERN